MKVESDPIGDEEFLLRRFPNLDLYYDPQATPPVTALAFKPIKQDTDGISLYREIFVTIQDVAAGARTPNWCYIVRLRAKEIRTLGITIEPTPSADGLPGHCSIPELAVQHYEAGRAEKDKHKDIHLELAKLASKDIVYFP